MQAAVSRPCLRETDDLLSPEREVWAAGFCRIAGVDEAGRGPLAGPVVAGAVVFPRGVPYPGVFDSKQLSEAARIELDEEIRAVPGIAIGVGVVEAGEIDRLNILKATHLAMRKAVLAAGDVDYVLVDGLPVKGLPVESRSIVKGDAKCASIAAASIIAKVWRDRMMAELDALYPGYGWAENKGYGTAAHLEALKKLGPTPQHRMSFRPVREVLMPPPEQPELF